MKYRIYKRILKFLKKVYCGITLLPTIYRIHTITQQLCILIRKCLSNELSKYPLWPRLRALSLFINKGHKINQFVCRTLIWLLLKCSVMLSQSRRSWMRSPEEFTVSRLISSTGGSRSSKVVACKRKTIQQDYLVKIYIFVQNYQNGFGFRFLSLDSQRVSWFFELIKEVTISNTISELLTINELFICNQIWFKNN